MQVINYNRRTYKHTVRSDAYIFGISLTNTDESSAPICDNRCWQGNDGCWYIELTNDEFMSFVLGVQSQFGVVITPNRDRRSHPHVSGYIEIYDDYRE